MSRVSTNVRIRPNVISLDDFKSRPTADFQKALTWEELHQYAGLFWQNQRSEVLARLTPEQQADRDYLLMTGQRLPDPYLQICCAHQFLLAPSGSANSGKTSDSPWVEEPPVKVPAKDSVSTAQENPQERVIRAPVDARQLVLAPPGTGKTHTVIERLAHLNQVGKFGGDLSQVLLVCFSRAAAAEIGQRLTASLRQGVGQVFNLPRLSTLDSLAGQLLVRDLGLPAQDQGFDESIRSLTDVLSGARGPQLRKDAATLLHQRVRVVIIDEVQDVVGVRARLVRALLEVLKPVAPGVLVLGDLRQAIHGFALKWQTAEDQDWTPFRLVRELQALFPDLERIDFTQQHRFSPTCRQLMTDLRGAMDGVPPALPGENPDRDRLRRVLTQVQELDDPHMLFGAEFAGKRVAVLARNNDEVDQLELACQPIARELGRTVRRSGDGGQGYPAWVARVLADQSALGSLNEDSFLRLYRQRICDDPLAARQALDWLAAACRLDPRAFHIADIFDTIEGNARVPTDLREPARHGEVWLSTIHQAKGREFETVVVSDPAKLLRSSEPEEARILYVALTRAKSVVFRCRGPLWLPPAFQAPDVSIELAGDSLPRLQASDFQQALWHSHSSFREVFVVPAQDGAYYLEIVAGTHVGGPRVTTEFLNAVADQAGVPHNVLKLERPTFRLEIGSLRSRVVGVLEERQLVLVPIFSGPVPVRR